MARRWLVKTDPRRFSFEDLRAARRCTWRGVTQAHALGHLRSMRRGEEVLVYHLGAQRAVTGIARVRRGAYPDPSEDDPRRAVVDLAVVRALRRPVSLAELRAFAGLSDWALLRVPRLSVMPVPAAAWRTVLRLETRPVRRADSRRGP